jgi:hypothetical protein
VNKSWVWVLLLLSLGVNVGILATIGVARLKGPGRFDPGRFDSQPFDARRGGQSADQRMPRERFKPPLDRMADNLELEGDSREEFLALQEEFFQRMIEHREALQTTRRQLRSEVVATEPDAEEIDGLLVELGTLHSGLERVMVDNVLATRSLLDGEQQQRYFHMLRRIREATERGGPRGADGGRGPGGRGPMARGPNGRVDPDDPQRRRPERKPPG